MGTSATAPIAADPMLGMVTAIPSTVSSQGGGLGGIITPARVERRDPLGAMLWSVEMSSTNVALDAQGNVLVLDYGSLAKLDARTGGLIWCIGLPNVGFIADGSRFFSMDVSLDGTTTLVGGPGPITVVAVSPSGCILRDQQLVLPAPMMLKRGGAAVSQWGDVHIAGRDEHIRVASFSPDGTLTGSGVYGRASKQPAPVIAAGPTGNLVLAGGFARDDLNLGTTTLQNALAWTTDAFLAKSPSLASLGSPSAVQPPAASPVILRSAEIRGIATAGTKLYWLERGATAAESDLYRCTPPDCGPGLPEKIGAFSNGVLGLAASSAGVSRQVRARSHS